MLGKQSFCVHCYTFRFLKKILFDFIITYNYNFVNSMNDIYIIYGLTGTGKTERAVKLAKKIGGYCISADSRQWYVGSPIGSNQPQGKMVAPHGSWKKILNKEKYLEVDGVPYLACNSWNKKRPTTVMDFKKYVFNILKRQQKYAPQLTPIIVGGTGLYIKAILYPEKINPTDKPNLALRKKLVPLSLLELQHKLKKLDPAAYNNLNDHKNPYRLIRAIEKHSHVPSKAEGSLRSIRNDRLTQNLKLKTNNSFKLIYHKKNLSLVSLEKLLNKRTQAMLKNNWLLEVKTLLKKNPRHPLLTGIGYQEIINFLNYKITELELVQKINTAQRHYAKRQKTFFKNQF